MQQIHERPSGDSDRQLNEIMTFATSALRLLAGTTVQCGGNGARVEEILLVYTSAEIKAPEGQT